MGTALTIIRTQKDREEAMLWVTKAEVGTRIQFRGPTRTLPQNDKIHAMITDIIKQKKTINGQTFDMDDWKVIFLDALNQELRTVPSLDGDRFIPVGKRTSELSEHEASDLIEVIAAWGTQNDVRWSDPAMRGYEEMMR